MSSLVRVRTGKALRGLVIAALAVAALAANVTAAHAAQYRALLCAGNVRSNAFGTATNTASPKNPGGIFDFSNLCGPAPDPAGENAFLRIAENQSGGNAGAGAFGDIFWDTPAFIEFKTAGGYSREPNAFNEGWRARFWGVDFANNNVQFMTQGANLPEAGTQHPLSRTFGPHVWPFNFQLDFHRFVFELECVRPAGCDRSGFNAADANTFQFTLNDVEDSRVSLTNTDTPLFSNQWVRGPQNVTWASSDNGSGLRLERVLIDNSSKLVIDYQATGACNTGSSGASGEFARVFQPCPTGGPFPRTWTLDTASLPDGTHPLAVCTQDYGQYEGLNGTGGQSCAPTTIRTDNTPPSAPVGVEVTSANPARYLDHVDAHWSLAADPGSPIAKVHYEIVDAGGAVVVPEKTVSGRNLTQLSDIEGPPQPGDYRLRLWLEDSVGFNGPPATVAIPHDTTPPAAPQEISVTAPDTSRGANGFDLRWRDIVDAGSPIVAAHYQVLDADGQVVVQTQTIGGEGVQTIRDLDAPNGRGQYSLRLWLSDAEGNVGAPASVPLAYDCQRSEIATGTSLSAGLGRKDDTAQVVRQGEGSLLGGRLSGPDGAAVAGASLCVYSRVVTDQGREFLGLAVSGAGGRFQFAIPAGASRELKVEYRSGHRELSSEARLETVVHPFLKAKKKIVYNKHFAYFLGRIPGPDNDDVVVNLQVKKGKRWLTFRRYRTRSHGQVSVGYQFKRTFQRTRYRVRGQIRQQSGYPYVQGNSRPITLIVRPKPPRG